MSVHRVPIRWIAAACGLGVLLASAPARADKMDYAPLQALAAILLLSVALAFVVALGILIAALVLGRRTAPVAPWKRGLAIAGIVTGSVCTLLSLIGCGTALWFIDAFASTNEKAGLVGGGVAATLVVLAVPVCAVVWSNRLYRRNKVRPSPPP